MVEVYRAAITAEDIKRKARTLGADLVGIADGKLMDANPPDPADPRRPSDITDYDGDRVIVLAKRINAGATRLPRWDDRHKYYNDELAVTALEETALELVLWLEKQGYPALIVPPTHVDPWRYRDDPSEHLEPLLSLPHAAVEAGLGTLGLNLQLLTPEFGPRVVLTALLSSAPVTADKRREDALCLGPECGRCLKSCPGDVIGHWERDWAACDRYRAPHGFHQLADFLGAVLEAPDVEAKKNMLRSATSFNLWQSILRGAGVITGCRRCQDVCPVGADYEALLGEALAEIPETNAEKEARLDTMKQTTTPPAGYTAQQRWIGRMPEDEHG